MNRQTKIPLRALVVLAAVLAGCSGEPGADRPDPRIADASRPLVLLTNPAEPPYSYIDENGEIAGRDIELGRRIADRMGRKLIVEGVPFGDILPRLKAGTADMGISTITIKAERLRDVDFSIPYEIGGSCFLYMKNGIKPRMSQAMSIRVGAESDTTQDLYLCRHGCDPVRYKNLEEGVGALVAGAVDALFFDMPPLKALAAKPDSMFAVSPPVTCEAYGVAVDKRRQDVLDAANAEIAERGGR